MNSKSSSTDDQATHQTTGKPSAIFVLMAALGVAYAGYTIFLGVTGDVVWYGRLLLACLVGAYSIGYLVNLSCPEPKERRLRAVSAANTAGVIAFLVLAVVKFLFA